MFSRKRKFSIESEPRCPFCKEHLTAEDQENQFCTMCNSKLQK